MTDKTRISDLEYLQKVIENPMTSSGERRQAEEAIRKICNESGLVRSMRERLIKEMRMGRTANIRDISEYTHSKANWEKYQT